MTSQKTAGTASRSQGEREPRSSPPSLRGAPEEHPEPQERRWNERIPRANASLVCLRQRGHERCVGAGLRVALEEAARG